MTPKRIATILDRSISGKAGVVVTTAAKIFDAPPGSLTWMKNYEVAYKLGNKLPKNTCIIVPEVSCGEQKEVLELLELHNAVIVSEHPRLDFARALKFCFGDMEMKIPDGVHETAVIETNAKIGERVTIGPFCYVGHWAKIGDGTVLGPRASVHSRCIVGQNCYIGTGSVVGERGFGYVKDENGLNLHMPQIGIVVIEDRVEIHAGTVIDRPSLGETIVREGSVIDNLCHIAHGADIGPEATIVACAEIGANVKIGAQAWFGPNSTSIENIEVGAGALVGIGSVLTRSVPEKQIFAGSPAENIDAIKAKRKLINNLLLKEECRKKEALKCKKKK